MQTCVRVCVCAVCMCACVLVRDGPATSCSASSGMLSISQPPSLSVFSCFSVSNPSNGYVKSSLPEVNKQGVSTQKVTKRVKMGR